MFQEHLKNNLIKKWKMKGSIAISQKCNVFDMSSMADGVVTPHVTYVCLNSFYHIISISFYFLFCFFKEILVVIL